MDKKLKITASIVLYQEDVKTLQNTIDSFLATKLPKHLFLIDNSPIDRLRNNYIHPEITYIHTRKNLGFGKAHNVVLPKINADYHLILNPDVVFNPNVIPNLITVLEQESTVAMITPKVVYPDGSLQIICRKNPTPLVMIARRLGILKALTKKHSYLNREIEKSFFPEFIHGCFMLFKTADFKKINGFDERYFLYLEDADICRKVYQSQKKIMYYPDEKITHIHRKGSSKRVKLLKYHVISAIKYFKKWGV